MVQTKIYRPNEAFPDEAGAVVYDGDGDGTSAAAIWLMANPGQYVSITNKRKFDRNLVKLVPSTFRTSLAGKKVAVFDLGAEDNKDSLESLANSGADITFVDHHTRDPNAIPSKAKRYFEQDARDNCTATIAYKIAEEQGCLEETIKRLKAAQLAVIGLANDGKTSASEQFGSEIIAAKDRTDLITYAKAINFGSGNASIDSTGLLQGFSYCDSPIEHLRNSKDINSLVDLRASTIKSMLERARVMEKGDLKLYVLPGDSPEDRENAFGSYNELATSLMGQDPTKVIIVSLQIPEGKQRVSFRSLQGRAFKLASEVAEKYGRKATGRETAAGFDSPVQINYKDILER